MAEKTDGRRVVRGGWRLGQRVARERSFERGDVSEAQRNGLSEPSKDRRVLHWLAKHRTTARPQHAIDFNHGTVRSRWCSTALPKMTSIDASASGSACADPTTSCARSDRLCAANRRRAVQTSAL